MERLVRIIVAVAYIIGFAAVLLGIVIGLLYLAKVSLCL